MVLICADPSEAVTAFLLSRLVTLRIDHRILDLRVAPEMFSVESSLRDGQLSGSICFEDLRVSFDELTGVYFRNVPLDEPGDETGNKTDEPYPRIDPRIAAVFNSLPSRIVNRPAATYSNRSKPYQSLIIRRCNFKIPKTLITDDVASARTFYVECNGDVISKSISGSRSAVQRISERDLQPVGAMPHRPTQFQEYLPGDNIRVHVIGESLFAVRIQSKAVDYRYAGREGYARTIVPMTLPETICRRCVRLTKELGLTMSGIDLKETPSGEYYCLEVNTSPAFPFYESPARPVVADALGQFLAQRGEQA